MKIYDNQEFDEVIIEWNNNGYEVILGIDSLGTIFYTYKTPENDKYLAGKDIIDPMLVDLIKKAS